MPGIVTGLTNVGTAVKHHMINKPHYTLVILIAIILFLIFSNRLVGLHSFNAIIFLFILFSIIIASTFLSYHGLYEDFSSIFNSSGSRNFLSVFLLVFFIILVYEEPMYDTNSPYQVLNILTFGHNKLISNRLVGFFVIIFFAIVSALLIYSTTRET